MKNKKRLRSWLGMTILMAIGAAVVWQIDPLEMDRIPRYFTDSNLETIDETPPRIEDETVTSHAPSAPDQSPSGDSAEPPIQDFVFEPEADLVDEDEPEVLQSEFAADELFESPPAESVGETPTEFATETASEIHVDAIEISPRAHALRSEPVIAQDSSVITVAGTESDGQSPANNSAVSPEHLMQIDNLIDNGNVLAAHKRLSAWYWNHPQDRPQFQKTIEQLARSIYFSPQPHYEKAYVIQPGDQLRKISKRYKLSWQYLARLNRVNPRKIRVGQKLKVVNGPFDAVVDLSDFQLTILCRGQYVRQYQVGIGKDGTSPIGKFTVKDKLEDPVYYGPDGVIANDSPDNPLGERWIDIGDSFGIHGTIDPESIGKSESRGCIRMLNDDVAEVYDFLTVGSTVWIRR